MPLLAPRRRSGANTAVIEILSEEPEDPFGPSVRCRLSSNALRTPLHCYVKGFGSPNEFLSESIDSARRRAQALDRLCENIVIVSHEFSTMKQLSEKMGVPLSLRLVKARLSKSPGGRLVVFAVGWEDPYIEPLSAFGRVRTDSRLIGRHWAEEWPKSAFPQSLHHVVDGENANTGFAVTTMDGDNLSTAIMKFDWIQLEHLVALGDRFFTRHNTELLNSIRSYRYVPHGTEVEGIHTASRIDVISDFLPPTRRVFDHVTPNVFSKRTTLAPWHLPDVYSNTSRLREIIDFSHE